MPETTKNPDGRQAFRKRTIAAGLWSFSGVAAKAGMTFVFFTILAYPIGPELYGTVGMVLVVARFALVFLEAGFTAALIQKKGVEERHFSSVFWLNLIMGVGMACVFAACSPLIAWFFNGNQALIPLTIYLSLIFVISALTMVQRAQITRKLDLKTIMMGETLAVLIAGLIAVAMAYSGFGVWSIATQTILVAAVLSAWFWCRSSWRPKFIFDVAAIRELFGFSINLLATKSLDYWVRNLDKILIAKFLGDAMLGLYSSAYKLMMLPVSNVSSSMSRVLFPSFSSIQEQHDRIRSIYLRSCRVISLVTFPVMFGVCATADHLIPAAIGAKWVDMIPVLKVLCLIGAIQSISRLMSNLYLSQGRTDLQFRVTCLLRGIMVAGIVIGLNWGIVGVATGYLIAVAVAQVPNFYYSGGLIGLKFSTYFRSIAPTLGASVTMYAVLFGFARLIDGRVGVRLAAVSEIVVGIGVYSAIVLFFRMQALTELLRIAEERGVRIPLINKFMMKTA